MKRAKRMRRPRRRPAWFLRRPLLTHQAQALAQAASVYSAAKAMRDPAYSVDERTVLTVEMIREAVDKAVASGVLRPVEDVTYWWSGRLGEFDAMRLTPIPPWFGMEFSEVYDPTNFEAKPSA